jgi:polysaccharide deacetylase family protein (PEP-CTERM system associated)
MTNYLTVDLEEYFHVGEDFIPESRWGDFPSRVERNVEDLLALLDHRRVRATFFVLGWVAQRHPDLIDRVREAGHCIASHGYSHRLAYRLTPGEFEEDLERSARTLEGITRRRPSGYRAPRWSLGRGARWAFPILARRGFTYDSSMAPCPFIGCPDYPREPHRIGTGDAAIREYPILAGDLGVRGTLLGGGWALRILSLSILFEAVEGMNTRSVPAVINIHPWEVDPDPPRLEQLPPVARFVHYAGLRGFRERLDEILRHLPLAAIPE